MNTNVLKTFTHSKFAHSLIECITSFQHLSIVKGDQKAGFAVLILPFARDVLYLMKKLKKIHSGHLLLAQPFMLDPYFRRSVVLLCEHDKEEGTIGFILNKSVRMQVSELVNDFPDFEAEVYYGGPVRTDTLHYMHTLGEQLEGAAHVVDNIYWGGHFDQLKMMIENGRVHEDDIRFFVGYSGWDPTQLEQEIRSGSWIPQKGQFDYIFKENYDNLWREVLNDKGNVYSVIGQVPDFVALN